MNLEQNISYQSEVSLFLRLHFPKTKISTFQILMYNITSLQL